MKLDTCELDKGHVEKSGGVERKKRLQDHVINNIFASIETTHELQLPRCEDKNRGFKYHLPQASPLDDPTCIMKITNGAY